MNSEELFKQLYFDRSVYQGDCGGVEEPWLTREAILFLESYLTKDMDILEFGSGTSTIWFAKRVKSITTVEHNKQWEQILQDNLQKESITNCQILSPKNVDYSDITFNTLPLYDFILVDGEGPSRVPSLQASIKLLKPSGVIMVDDIEYEGYRPILDFMATKFPEMKRFGLQLTKKGTTSWWQRVD